MPLLLLAVSLLPLLQAPGDLEDLLAGVTVLPRLGVPGPVCTYGEDAFPVLTGRIGRAAVPVVAAARYGQGRAVAFGHGAWLGRGGWGNPDGARMLRNAIQWAGRHEAGGPPLRVALDGIGGGTGAFLEQQGFRVVPADGAGDSAPQVLLWTGAVPTSAERLAELRAFVAGGGGLICGTCAWGVQQIHSASGFRIRRDLPENAVLAPMGLVFADGYVEASGEGGFPLAASHPDVAHAGRALGALLVDLDTDAPDPAARLQALRTVEMALAAVPDAGGFLERVEAACGPARGRVPAAGSPVSVDDPLARLAMLAWWRRHEEDTTEAGTIAPGAGFFPGAVPADAPRVRRQVRVPAGRRGWFSTGLYAAPGEVVAVGTPEILGPGWRLRVGCHADILWGKERWRRWPEVSRSAPLPAGGRRFASPFGGLIYLESPGAGHDLVFTIEGAVEAPFFDLEDPASAADWPRRRAAAAPWAEFRGRHLVITVPAAGIRGLDNPAPVLRWWDRVLEVQAWLAARQPATARPERFVADIQISAGYMHAGYPIMTWLDVATPKAEGGLPFVLDLAQLRAEGSWGHFHELGHNLQRGWWTFAGTGEVTNNLFTLYAMDQVAGIEPWAHPWLAGQKKKEAPYLDKGAPFAEWQRDPGLALLFFARIQRAFGWEPFHRFFAAGEALAPGARPRGEEAERDAWLVGLSRECGRDLGPWFRRWGIPVSAAAVQAAHGAGEPWDGARVEDESTRTPVTPPLSAGSLRAWLESPGGELPFGLEFTEGVDAAWRNGEESISVALHREEDGVLVLEVPRYDSRIRARLRADGRRLDGTWRRASGPGQSAELPFHAVAGPLPRFLPAGRARTAPPLAERWAVRFASEEDPAVGIFHEAGDGTVTGTFLTTLGDYRYLAGRRDGDLLRLSTYDGAHAFLFTARRQADGTLRGDFWSRDSWHDTWTGDPDPAAALPDGFGAGERWNPDADLGALRYPGLDGRLHSPADPEYAGRARIVVLFGTWCPNCNDEAPWLAELDRRYRDRGLSILGLAFELTGERQRDMRQLQRFVGHHGIRFPVLLAGRADKEDAPRVFPALREVKAWPTTLFLDRDGRLRALHEGFAGPATGAAGEHLRERFVSLVEELLGAP